MRGNFGTRRTRLFPVIVRVGDTFVCCFGDTFVCCFGDTFVCCFGDTFVGATLFPVIVCFGATLFPVIVRVGGTLLQFQNVVPVTFNKYFENNFYFSFHFRFIYFSNLYRCVSRSLQFPAKCLSVGARL